MILFLYVFDGIHVKADVLGVFVGDGAQAASADFYFYQGFHVRREQFFLEKIW